ncbi:MAG: hypothetical protein PVH64_05405 [Bacillota bacterium]|jgi:hypothetical protein
MFKKIWLIFGLIIGLVLVLCLIYFFQKGMADKNYKTGMADKNHQIENAHQNINITENNQVATPFIVEKVEVSSELKEDEWVMKEYEAELTVSGISLDSSVEKVIEVFGRPIRKERRDIQTSRHSDTTLIYFDTWVYEKAEFTFATIMEKNTSVSEKPPIMTCISTSDDKYRTKKGIGIGDSVEKFVQQYGNVEPEEGFYSYGTDDIGYEYINFKVENGKISLIVIYTCNGINSKNSFAAFFY